MQYVLFELAQRTYGIDIRYVRSVERTPPITRLPGAAHQVLGLVNVRGVIIPMLDLPRLLGSPVDGCLASSCGVGKYRRTLVVEVADVLVGIEVERTKNVREVPPDRIQPVSEELLLSSVRGVRLNTRGEAADTVYSGCAEVDGVLVILLDVVSIVAERGVSDGLIQ